MNNVSRAVRSSSMQMRRLSRAFSAHIHKVWTQIKAKTKSKTDSPAGYIYKQGHLNDLFARIHDEYKYRMRWLIYGYRCMTN